MSLNTLKPSLKPQFGFKQKIGFRQKQQGSAIIVAIVVIVMMSVLGLGLTQLLNKSSENLIVEVYGARAHFAAQSGAEVYLAQLYSTGVDCTANRGVDTPVTETYNFNNIDGLKGCTSSVQCTRLRLEPYPGVHYRIISQGFCEASGQQFSRELILEARDEYE